MKEVIIGLFNGLFGIALGYCISHYLAVKREKRKRLYEEKKKHKEDAERESKEFRNNFLQPLNTKQLVINQQTGELEEIEKRISEISNCAFACFLKGSQVLMSNGTSKSIEDIVTGDIVKTIQMDLENFDSCKVHDVTCSIVDSYVLINKKLKLTASEMLCTSKGFTRVSELSILDSIFKSDRSFEKIDCIEHISERADVYNLIIGVESFFVNNYLVGGMLGKNGIIQHR